VTGADQLSERLLTPEQAAELDAPGSKDAAVLIPLYPRGDDLVAIFTVRRDDLRRHAGEISFPGGRQDFPEEDLRTTALREADEEIGLAPEAVELVGALPPTGTFVTSYKIHPFVGLIEPGHSWRPQETEVAEVLELSLDELVAGYEMQRLLRRHGSCTTSWTGWALRPRRPSRPGRRPCCPTRSRSRRSS